MTLLRIVVGVALLTSGRKLYWLFVGALGFAAASYLTTQYLGDMDRWAVLGISMGVGIIGALLAVWMQGFALGLAGFLGGGQLALSLMGFFGLDSGNWVWMPFLVFGMIGVALLLSLFDWALITLSALGGTSLIVQAIAMPRSFVPLVFVVIAVFDVILQSQAKRMEADDPH
jgi:hypothetical protein